MKSYFEIISTFNASYSRCIDTDALENWPNFFANDCFYKITTAENVKDNLPAGLVYADSKNMLLDRISALREANIYERQSYRHILSTPYVLSESDTQIESETPFAVIRIMHDGKTDLFCSGIYKDIFLIDSNKALLKERIVICDSNQIDTLLAIPL